MFFITSISGLTRFVKLFGKSYPQVPVIGIGGISNANDALEFFMAGASAIQIGIINFTNPRAGIEIIEGIEEFMHQERIESIKELVGEAL